MKKIIIFVLIVWCANIFANENKMQVWRDGARGVNILTKLSLKDLIYLRDNWGANAIRVMCIDNPLQSNQPPFNYIQKNWDRLDSICAYAKRAGLYVIIDPHFFPGVENPKKNGNKLEIWGNSIYHDNFLKLWRKIAEKFVNEPEIIGYDLFNEPGLGKYNPDLYDTLIVKTIKTIRQIDKNTPIIIEPPSHNKIKYDLNLVTFIKNYSNLVLSFHYYQPFEYIIGKKDEIYPGFKSKLFFNNGDWKEVAVNKNELLKTMLRFKNFQEEYKVPIFIGEFDTWRWIPGGDKWVADVINICNQFNWSWTYFAYRDGSPNNPELGTDKNNKKPMTDNTRIEILKQGFLLNKNNYFTLK